MREEIQNIKNEKSDLRKFGITIGVVLVIISGFLFWKERESFQLFITVGTILFILGVAIPVVLNPIYWAWMIFVTILGWFMTRLILSLLFYVIITPIGLISRFSGKQFLELRWDISRSSYWDYSSKIFDRESFEKQF